ncbi:lamin tail domain-containing protein [Xanthomonadaceae bacterium JHOS43]|nr:lamin tail domain-containing protein [Xanthomonadaceae bacterium JHOS43]
MAPLTAPAARADTTPQSLPFLQDWSDINLITANDNWDGVPGIVGYLGEDSGTTTAPYAGGNPQTLTAPVVGNTGAIDVVANQTNNNSTNGGVLEWHLTNPVVGFAGSGTADAPHLVIHLDTTGFQNIQVSYLLRDIETADNSVQPVALLYRVGNTGDFVNVPDAYVADASAGPSLTLDTPVSVTLPPDADNQAEIQLRIITVNVAGNDENIGVDDISVTGDPLASSGPADLLFSEYIEGASNNKALEIFNGTGAGVDLAAGQYRLELYQNGSATVSQSVALTGTIADGDVLVVCHASAATNILSACDLPNSTVIAHNGDDAFVLRKNSTAAGVGDVVDSFGDVGTDPGTSWGTGDYTTHDHTLRRKPEVCEGDTVINDGFADPSIEWISYPIGTHDGLGSHVVSCTGGGVPTLPSVSFAAGEVSVVEGDATASTLTFAVNFAPAIAANGTLSFDIGYGGDMARYACGGNPCTTTTVTLDDTDESPYLIEVQTVPDTDTNGDATVTITLSNFMGAAATQADPLSTSGTIVDDDIAFEPISSIQGAGQVSPRVGNVVTTRGVVTGVTSNSRHYYLQSLPGDQDADPATSEGLYVFGTAASPAGAGLAVGDFVYVTGTVVEYSPATGALPITELSSSTTTKISSGTPLPAPVVLTAADLDPAGDIGALERYEFMRVTVPRFQVTAPSGAAANYEFFGVLEGAERPFREAGVNLFRCGVDPAVPGSVALPAEAPANVPCWDNNPELLRVNTTLLSGGTVIPVRSGTVLEGLTGVLDYAVQRYTILTRSDEAPMIDASNEAAGTPVTSSNPTEVTIGTFNVENLACTLSGEVCNSPGSATYNRKATKISRAIVDYLHTPDVLGLIEVGNIQTLQDISSRVSAIAANDPQYEAIMVSESGTQRLGFLIKKALVGASPRVQLVGMPQQYGADERVLCPDGVSYTTGLLNDRAPLVIDVAIRGANGEAWPVTIINNHLKSMIDLESTADADTSYACFNDPDNPGGGEGRRNRAKRQQNAEYLAMLVDTLQNAQPDRAIVVVGDFNAYEFSDGLADLLGTVKGEPTPDDETVVIGDGVDLVEPDLVLLTELIPPQQRYSYTYEGNAQTIDHTLVNQGVIAATVDIRAEFARVNSDFHQGDAANDANAFANSDHDPVLAFLDIAAFRTADLTLGTTPAPAAAEVGDEWDYAFELSNAGPDEAVLLRVELTLPTGILFLSLDAPSGWSCTTPAIGTQGSVVCNIDTLAADADAAFIVTVMADVAASGTTAQATVSVASGSADPTPPESAIFTTEVAALPDEIFKDGFED